ncbi:hypothetical protein ABER75_11645 [Niallia taxi]|uniref:hypothetical protein n=1 Tax=Niallia taxi TaxID=2499688 RepID=UPI00203F8BA7|nr:hypothetical protein [Niallia taxi]MCM3216746.1 hypothetical protein [Niallia taxi]
MNLSQIISGLGIFTAGSIVITSILGFIAKSIFNNWMNNRSLHYKTELDNKSSIYKANLDKEMEHFKLKLQIETTEHQIKYTKLHEDRANTIKELYKYIVNMEQSLNSLVSLYEFHGEDGKEKKAQKYMQSFNTAYEYYHINKIYLSENTCSIIDSLLDELRGIWSEFYSYDLINGLSEKHVERQEQREVWRTCYKEMKEKVPKIKRDLENDFRSMLGVS